MHTAHWLAVCLDTDPSSWLSNGRWFSMLTWSLSLILVVLGTLSSKCGWLVLQRTDTDSGAWKLQAQIRVLLSDAPTLFSEDT